MYCRTGDCGDLAQFDSTKRYAVVIHAVQIFSLRGTDLQICSLHGTDPLVRVYGCTGTVARMYWYGRTGTDALWYGCTGTDGCTVVQMRWY